MESGCPWEKHRAQLVEEVLGRILSLCHFVKAMLALEDPDEMSLPKLILSLAMSLVGVEMALFLLLCFRNYFSCEWETLTGVWFGRIACR